MKVNLAKIIILSIYIIPFFIGLPTKIVAQEIKYTLLAPLPLQQSGCQGNEIGDNTCETTASKYIADIFMLIIGLATALAVVMIIWGGIQYMSTDAFTGKSDAKNTIENAIWGLLLVIGAWLILYTINPKLVKFNLSISRAPTSSPGGTYTTPPYASPSGGGPGDLVLSGAQATAYLDANGIGYDRVIRFDGIRQSTLEEAVNLKSSCGCTVYITSATGGEHKAGEFSHANGYKIDLKLNDNLNNYIFNNYTETRPRSNGDRVFTSPSGATYVYEVNRPSNAPRGWGPHWDVVVPG